MINEKRPEPAPSNLIKDKVVYLPNNQWHLVYLYKKQGR
jgi:hypothetical protein